MFDRGSHDTLSRCPIPRKCLAAGCYTERKRLFSRDCKFRPLTILPLIIKGVILVTQVDDWILPRFSTRYATLCLQSPTEPDNTYSINRGSDGLRGMVAHVAQSCLVTAILSQMRSSEEEENVALASDREVPLFCKEKGFRIVALLTNSEGG